MKRTTLSLIACATALAAVTGFAAVSAPGDAGTDTAAPAARLPVERTGLLCPAPSTSDLAETAYTSFTPVTQGADEKGSAALVAAESADATEDGKDGGKSDEKGGKDGQQEKPVLQPKAPGTPVAGKATGAGAPALIGTAEEAARPAGRSSRRRRSPSERAGVCRASTAPLRTRSSGSRAPARRPAAPTTCT